MKGLLVLIITILAFQIVYPQNAKSIVLLSVSALIKDNSALSIDDGASEEIISGFRNSLVKSYPTVFTVGGNNSGTKNRLNDVLDILDGKTDSSDFAIFVFIGGWQAAKNGEYTLINSVNEVINLSYITNSALMSPSKNTLQIFIMPSGYEIPSTIFKDNEPGLRPGKNILLITQKNKSDLNDLTGDFVAALNEIETSKESDLNSDGRINITEFFRQLEKVLITEKIEFKAFNISAGPELNLEEVK